MTSNAVQQPQTPGALRVAAAWARLRCSTSSTMTRHRLDRRALHPGPRRSQRDPRDFHHGLLGACPSKKSRLPEGGLRGEIVRNPHSPSGFQAASPRLASGLTAPVTLAGPSLGQAPSCSSNYEATNLQRN